MEFIDNKLRRYTTFSKRKTGIMKKVSHLFWRVAVRVVLGKQEKSATSVVFLFFWQAYELSTLTGTQVMLLVASETGHVYTFATRKLQPMITSDAGKALIQTCLNSPDSVLSHTLPSRSGDEQRMCATGFEETDLTYTVNDNDNSSEKVRVNSLYNYLVFGRLRSRREGSSIVFCVRVTHFSIIIIIIIAFW
jgi:serum response factor